MAMPKRLMITQHQLPDYLDAEALMNFGKPDRGKTRGCKICGNVIYTSSVCKPCFTLACTEEGFARLNQIPECSYNGCIMPIANFGLCTGHCTQLRSGNTLAPIRRKWGTETPEPICEAGECQRLTTSYRTRFCELHAAQRRNYGMSIDGYIEIKSRETCDACGGSDTLSIDHDHSCCSSNIGWCGQCIRGILCRNCNRALGLIKDNPQTLRALADYLESGVRLKTSG